MLYSCTHMATVGFKGLIMDQLHYHAIASYDCKEVMYRQKEIHPQFEKDG